MTKTIKRLSLLAVSAAVALAALGVPGAAASEDCFAQAQPGYGVAPGCFDGMVTANAAGEASTEAGTHPYDATNSLLFNTVTDPVFGSSWPAAPPKDIAVDLPPGLIGNPSVVPACELADAVVFPPTCAAESQVGSAWLRIANGEPGGEVLFIPWPVYSVEPPTGAPAEFAFGVFGTLNVIQAELRSGSDYGVTLAAKNVSSGLAFSATKLSFWGTPADPSHTPQRICPGFEPEPFGCSSQLEPKPLLRNPTSCHPGGQAWTLHTNSWFAPADIEETSFVSHRPPGNTGELFDPIPATPLPPESWGPPQGTEHCDAVPVKGRIETRPTVPDAETSSGLDVSVEIPNAGLEIPEAISSSDIKGVKLTLPQGVTINPSQAEGLGACSPAQYESSRLEFHPDGAHGCPSDSKIGTVSVETPLLEETIPGNVYVAKPYDNPFNSLLALYIVVEEPQRGILVKLPGEIRTNEKTGQIEAEFKDLPQFPFSTFDFKFREGARAPLVTPPTCGTYETVAEIEGWSDPGNPIVSKSSFAITRGIGAGPCPPGGVPGFNPGFSAGSINNNAGSHTSFNMRITRKDGEQDMTRFSAVLPPGVLGKLAGVEKCPDSAIAAAKARTGPHGGQEEIDSPSCPANSEIGRSLVGAGVGSVLTYVPGKVYLGGPLNGNPLSVIAITPVVAGPFDIGTVVVQEALTLNSKTAEVEVDGSASDPIPHMLKGIPAKLRDLRVYVDRPEFIVNPTSCDPSSTRAALFGGGGNAFSTLDDVPVSLSDRFQAASCAALGLKPRLKLHLSARRSTRGAFPRLRAVYVPRRGDANIGRLSAVLPNSELLENAHFRTICTRVQFDAGAGLGAQCPPGSVYGHVKAWTPLLEEPLQGSVYLRSSNHELPDMVLGLHGLVDIEAAARIDSVHGRIRSTFEGLPDAPLSRVVLNMRGGKKSLLVNSTDICRGKHYAKIRVTGQNGKISDLRPRMTANCKGSGRRRSK